MTPPPARVKTRMIRRVLRKNRARSRKPGWTRLDVASRRAQLLARGSALFSTRAYDEVSMDDVARAVGISKGLLYHYFPTKRDFYVAVLQDSAADLLARTDEPNVPPVERLLRGIDAYLAYVEAHGPAYVALLRGGIGSDDEVAAIVERTRQAFLERLLGGLAIDEPSPELRTVLRGWVGFVEASSIDWLEHRDLTAAQLRDLLATTLAQLLASIGVTPPGL